MRDFKGSDYLTANDIAAFTGVTRRTVYRWLKSGKITGYKPPMSQEWGIHKSELADFIAAGEPEGTRERVLSEIESYIRGKEAGSK